MNLRRKVLFQVCFAVAPLVLIGCATDKRYERVGQWVVVSTNVAAPRVTVSNLTATALSPEVIEASREELRHAIETTSASTALLQNVTGGKPLSLADLEELGRNKVADHLVVNYLRATDAVYVLTTQDLERMRASGVSEVVLNELLATRLRPTFVSRYEYYPVYRPYPYYYDPFWYSPSYYHHYHYHYPRSVIRR